MRFRLRAHLSCVLFLAAHGLTMADAVCPPAGIYCSCPPTNGFSHSVIPQVAALPFVDGTLVRVVWADLEPSPGVFDWTLLDDELARAAENATSVALGVICAATGEPDWLYQSDGGMAAAASFEFYFHCNPDLEPCDAERMPLPWDVRFLAEWTEFIAALGQRYGDHPQITLIHMTNASANGFEMQLPFTPVDVQAWNAAGYSAALHIASWETVIDAFAAAFPNKPLDVDVHPVLGSDAVAEAVAEYASISIGSRFGVFSAWWTQNNADNVYPGMYEMLLGSASSTFATVQFARSEVQHGAASFGTGGVAGALDRVIEDGIGYAEIWNADLLAAGLQSDFATGAEALRVVKGDLDSDGDVDIQDVDDFVSAVLIGDSIVLPIICIADMNGDSALDGLDIESFVEQLLGL